MPESPSVLTTFAAAIKEHFLKLIVLAAIFAFLAFMVAVFQPREYQAAGRLLIVPKGAVDLDAYAASRSGERLGSILKEVVLSNSFLDRVLAVGAVRNDYGFDQTRRLKLWKRRVSLTVAEASGVLNVSVYNPSRAQAVTTAQVVFQLIESLGPQFYGGKGVDIREVEAPVASPKPVRPKLLLVTVGGLIAGFIVGGGLLFLMTPEVMVRRPKLEYPFDPNEQYTPIVEA